MLLLSWKASKAASSPPSDYDYYLTTLQSSRARSLTDIRRYRGVVDQGYGRGGKQLGVPTANLPASLFQNALEDVETGVYFGWAVLEGQSNEIYKAVANVGYSPTFEGRENCEKIIEAHLIVEGSDSLPDFYGVPMRLQLIGFLREEKKFNDFPSLIAQIQADIRDAESSLDYIPYICGRNDPFLVVSDSNKLNSGTRPTSIDVWVGNGGGDAVASWEKVPIIPFLRMVL